MEKVFEVAFGAGQAARGDTEDFEFVDGRGDADFFDGFLVQSLIGDDATGGISCLGSSN